MGIGALIGGIGGALISSSANKSAAKTAAASAGEANALQAYIYDQTREDNAPWRAAGQNALARLTGLLNDGSLTSKFAGNVENEPGYQFGMQQGIDTAKMMGAARGGQSSARTNAATRFAQDYAGTQYQNAFNRFQTERQNQLDPLYRMAGFGSAANTANTSAGQNYANQTGANMMDAASIRGASRLGQGNIYGNALSQGIAAWNRLPPPGVPAYYEDLGGGGGNYNWGGGF